MSKRVQPPRVIIEYPGCDGKTQFAAGFIEGIGGSHLTLTTMFGNMTFSRDDGTWVSGPCLNYSDGKIRDWANVESSIKAGFFGDVAAYLASLPKAAEAVQ